MSFMSCIDENVALIKENFLNIHFKSKIYIKEGNSIQVCFSKSFYVTDNIVSLI